MKITINKQANDDYLRHALFGCPVSKAMSLALGKRVLVDYDVISIDGVSYRPPQSVRYFTQHYDETGEIIDLEFDTDDLEPTRFELANDIGVRGTVGHIRRRSTILFYSSLFTLALTGSIFGMMIGGA